MIGIALHIIALFPIAAALIKSTVVENMVLFFVMFLLVWLNMMRLLVKREK